MLLRSTSFAGSLEKRAKVLEDTMTVVADPAQIVIFNSHLGGEGGGGSNGDGFASETLSTGQFQHAMQTLDQAILAAVLATTATDLEQYLSHTMVCFLFFTSPLFFSKAFVRLTHAVRFRCGATWKRPRKR
jgi:hypothetical protein